MKIGITGLGGPGSALARGLHAAGCPDEIYGCHRGAAEAHAPAGHVARKASATKAFIVLRAGVRRESSGKADPLSQMTHSFALFAPAQPLDDRAQSHHRNAARAGQV